MRLLGILLGLLGLAGGCIASPDESRRVAEYAAAGPELVELLRSGEFAALAGRLHYPPSYSAEELEKDRTNVSRTLSFLHSEFGAFGPAEPVTGAVNSYSLEVGGGDLRYWQTQEQNAQDGYVRYRVDYDRLGPGFIAFAFYGREGRFEVRAIRFELDASQPGARQTIVAVGKRMLAAKQIPDPEKAPEALEPGLPKLP